ncbi:hypothetical protein Tco_0311070 [Tanacetum coccineum]
MGYKLLRLRIDSRKVDIWLLELGLQWLLRRAAECCAGRLSAAPGGRVLCRAAECCAGRQSAAPGGRGLVEGLQWATPRVL